MAVHPLRSMNRAWSWLLGHGRAANLMPPWVFYVQLLWLLALFALFAVYATSSTLRGALPHHFGHIPVGVPWFGALGGCLVSFGGIFQYNRSWNAKFNWWHPVRPLIGTATGSVACVLLLATLHAASPSTKLTDAGVFDGAAFVFGYAESAFRQLVKALTDVLLKPGGGTSGSGGSGGGAGGPGPAGGGGGGGEGGGGAGAPSPAKPSTAGAVPSERQSPPPVTSSTPEGTAATSPGRA